MDTETISVRIGKDVYDRIVAIAEAEYRPIRGQIELLLADALQRRRQLRHGDTQSGQPVAALLSNGKDPARAV